MIQDIEPYIYDNSYDKNATVSNEDYVLIFDKNEVFTKVIDGKILIPTFEDLKEKCNISNEDLIYVFKISKFKFFLLRECNLAENAGLVKQNTSIFRTLEPKHMGFAGITAKHLNEWYSLNKYCGRCGHELVRYDKERAMYCEKCKNIIYPTISPAIIVGIINKGKILLTKYSRGNYKNYALIAGFVEVGESVEDTVKREAMEEVGLKVKNIRYYKSQPWGFSNSLLVGFFADLDGDDKVTLEEDELGEATWYSYDDMPERDSLMSLTHTMIEEFKIKKGKV